MSTVQTTSAWYQSHAVALYTPRLPLQSTWVCTMKQVVQYFSIWKSAKCSCLATKSQEALQNNATSLFSSMISPARLQKMKRKTRGTSAHTYYASSTWYSMPCRNCRTMASRAISELALHKHTTKKTMMTTVATTTDRIQMIHRNHCSTNYYPWFTLR